MAIQALAFVKVSVRSIQLCRLFLWNIRSMYAFYPPSEDVCCSLIWSAVVCAVTVVIYLWYSSVAYFWYAVDGCVLELGVWWSWSFADTEFLVDVYGTCLFNCCIVELLCNSLTYYVCNIPNHLCCSVSVKRLNMPVEWIMQGERTKCRQCLCNIVQDVWVMGIKINMLW